tara:strand:+ start:245 stop:967 length:723 start_codon:yes stop_codon:yes gene_type:complete
MNREKNLEKALPSWTDYDEINEIIIVDWSSKKPLKDNSIIQELANNSPKIKIARVNNEPYFSLPKSYNLAASLISPANKIFLKLDCDFQSISNEWIKQLKFKNGELDGYCLRGHEGHEGVEPALSGILLINKKDFPKYNENLIGWGHDDFNLYARITTNRKPFPNIEKYVHHLPHTNEERTENYPIEDKSMTPNELRSKSHKNNLLLGKKKHWRSRIFRILKREKQYLELEFLPSPFMTD